MASLNKRPESQKPWQVRFRDHTGRSRSEQFTRKKDAEARLLEVQTAEETGRLESLDAGTATLSQVGVEYFRLNKRDWSESTAKTHAYTWNAVVEGESSYPRAALADMPVRNIRRSHIQEFKNDALDAGVPTSSVRRALSLLTRTLDHAADEDMIASNPAARVKLPTEAKRPKASIVTPQQVEALRAQLADPRDAVFVSILAYAGLRPHEARALRIEQFGGPELHLKEACDERGNLQPLKAGHDTRDVPICAALAADVAALDWPSGFMFTNTDGGPWTKTDYDNWRKRRFKKALTKANATLTKAAEVPLLPADLNPYDLRHSIASLWYRANIDKATIAYRLGHSIPVLESVYTSHFRTLDPADKRTVDELIAAARA